MIRFLTRLFLSFDKCAVTGYIISKSKFKGASRFRRGHLKL